MGTQEKTLDEHEQKLRETGLKKEPVKFDDELLRQHIRKLRAAGFEQTKQLLRVVA